MVSYNLGTSLLFFFLTFAKVCGHRAQLKSYIPITTNLLISWLVLVGFLLLSDRMLSITSRRAANRACGRREILISGASANKTDTS